MAITKEKGDLGQAMIMADLFKRGFKVLLPVGEDWKFDLVIYRNGKFERIQCKYDGIFIDTVFVNCRSCNNHSRTKYTDQDIDWIGIYHKASDLCYYIPSNLLGKGRAALSLRIKDPINKQKKSILPAKEFLKL